NVCGNTTAEVKGLIAEVGVTVLKTTESLFGELDVGTNTSSPAPKGRGVGANAASNRSIDFNAAACTTSGSVDENVFSRCYAETCAERTIDAVLNVDASIVVFHAVVANVTFDTVDEAAPLPVPAAEHVADEAVRVCGSDEIAIEISLTRE